MHRVAFAIDQKQDFFLSLAWVELLKRFHPDRPLETWALIVKGGVHPEFEPYLSAFDRVETLDGPYPPGRAELAGIPAMAMRARRFHRDVRALGLGREDVVVAYSFRELVVNAMIRALDGPRLVRVRGCNQELERAFTRRRPLAAAYRNAWNRAFGHGALRYRWSADSNRHGAGQYLHDPYDDEFCVTTAAAAEGRAGGLAWPFPVLREAYGGGDRDAPPEVVFLGEIYPPVEGMPAEEFRPFLGELLTTIRAGHPGHRLVFKPRSADSLTGIDLTGWEVDYADDVVESLLLRRPTIEKVLSFKSSGSLVAAQYGCDAYVLYPLLDLPGDFRAMLDEFFVEYRDSVTFVEDRGQLAGRRREAAAGSAARVAELARPLVDLLADPRGTG